MRKGDEMKQHPEQKEGEKWLGNFTVANYYKVYCKTKRMGKVAYYADLSKPLEQFGNDKLYPVFVQVSETESNGR